MTCNPYIAADCSECPARRCPLDRNLDDETYAAYRGRQEELDHVIEEKDDGEYEHL